MSEHVTGRLTRAHIVDWIVEAEIAKSAVDAVPRLYSAVRLGVKGDTAGYRLLAALALSMCDDTHKLRTLAVEVNRRKGQDYTQGSDDILKNFYEVASICGVSPLVVWGVYVTKHVEAIASWKRGLEASEPIESRLTDVFVYAALGYFIAEREAL